MQAFADLISGTFTKQFSDTSSSSSSSKVAPRLVEASAHDYISRSLQQCHENRVVIYYWILNGGVVAFLAIIIGLYLYYASKKKLSPEEVREKLLRENELIMNQIRLYRDEQKRIDSLTGLPMANLKRGQEETNMRPMVFFD
jgi:beta-lactamase regulating signal transducer with metallopeptidase domain